MNNPWFWIHIIPRLADGSGRPAASRYPVVGFAKQIDHMGEYTQDGKTMLVEVAGEVLLLIDDGQSVHAVKQPQTLRCQEPERTCPICATGRSDDARGYTHAAADAARH